MNEANHEIFRLADAPADTDDDGVRPVSWEEISARLSAQRQLARLFRKQGECRPARFGGLKSLASALGELPVNHDGLGNGKIAGDIAAFHHSAATTGDRGTA